MSIDRTLLFVLHQPASGTGPLPDSLQTTLGTFETTVGHTIDLPPKGASITAAAALTYSTVFVLDNTLGITDPITGAPVEIATFPADQAIVAPANKLAALVSLGSTAVLTASDGGNNTELVRTDGTFAGTVYLNPNGASEALDPTALVRLGNIALFAGTDTNGARGLWSTDGTSSGTFEVTSSDFVPTVFSQTYALGVVNGRAIFVSGTTFRGVATIVSSDGTAAGTQVIDANFGPALEQDQAANLASGLLLLTDGMAIYKTDGASALTTVETYSPTSGYAVNDLTGFGGSAAYVLYSGTRQTFASSLVVTDGTASGTHTITLPTTVGLVDTSALLTAFGSQLLFVTTEPDAQYPFNASDLWITDGTQSGTKEIAAGIDPISITVDGARAFVVGHDATDDRDVLYTTDGTALGTTAFLNSGSDQSSFSAGVLDLTHVFVTGTHDQYQIAPTATGAMAVVDTVPGRDGAATESGARVITFADGTGVLDPTGNAEALARIYQSALDRVPDIGGLVAYTTALDAGSTTLLQVANIGAASPEFIGAHGDTSSAAFVTALYQNTVGRQPDAGGLAGYVADLNGGESRGAVLLDISQSFEARHDGLGVAGQANDATVYRLYETVVDRAPDLAGQQFYSSALSSRVSVQTIASAMLASGEYASVFGNPSNSQFVTDLYENLLHRAPDAGGLAAYTADLANGASRAAVVAAFATGDEGRLTTSLATHDGWVYLG